MRTRPPTPRTVLWSGALSVAAGGWLGLVAGIGLELREFLILAGAMGGIIGAGASPVIVFALTAGDGVAGFLLIIIPSTVVAWISALLAPVETQPVACLASTGACYVGAGLWWGVHERIRDRTVHGGCPACGYDLHGLAGHTRCPECGDRRVGPALGASGGAPALGAGTRATDQR